MTHQQSLPELPQGWVLAKIEECFELMGGGTPSRQVPEYFGGNIVWLTPTEIPKNKVSIIHDSREKITLLGLNKSSARIIPNGAVLLTSRATIGSVAIAGCDVTTNQGFASFICPSSIYNFYVGYWLLANKDFIEAKATGTTFKEITKSKLKTFSFPLPPLAEQHRIVAKIEALFTQLDAGIAALRQVKTQLKRYRQAVLKAAFEGNFTHAHVKEGGLSEGWRVSTLGNILSISSGTGLTRANRSDEGEYFVYGGNGVAGKHNSYLYEEEKLIIGRVGVHCGNTHITKPKSWITDNAFVVTFDDNKIDLKFLHYLIRQLNLNKYSSSTAQPVISQGKIYPIEICYPENKNEQQAVVAEIERCFSIADEVEQTVDQSLQQAERLRQSILKQAFAGKLVSQDAQDEPVAVLLERIKAERARHHKTTGISHKQGFLTGSDSPKILAYVKSL